VQNKTQHVAPSLFVSFLIFRASSTKLLADDERPTHITHIGIDNGGAVDVE
jgi:hypothetical protein